MLSSRGVNCIGAKKSQSPICERMDDPHAGRPLFSHGCLATAAGVIADGSYGQSADPWTGAPVTRLSVPDWPYCGRLGRDFCIESFAKMIFFCAEKMR